jgi:hypothetical protein
MQSGTSTIQQADTDENNDRECGMEVAQWGQSKWAEHGGGLHAQHECGPYNIHICKLSILHKQVQTL